MMTSVGLTCPEKTASVHLSGCGIQLVSKKSLLSGTPALHLLATHAGESSSCLTLSSSSSSSSSVQDQCRASPQTEREVENLPPRRPLKLAPLSAEVKDTQRQKIKSPRPRKSKVCWTDTSARSPEGYALNIITEPLKPQQRGTKTLLQPINQLKLIEEAERVEGSCSNGAKSGPSSLCQNATPTQIYPTRAPENASRAVLSKSQDAEKRRMRLRRTNRLEEDQSKSSSSTGGLSADEGRRVSAGSGWGQGSVEKALRDAGRLLEKTSLKEPGGFSG